MNSLQEKEKEEKKTDTYAFDYQVKQPNLNSSQYGNVCANLKWFSPFYRAAILELCLEGDFFPTFSTSFSIYCVYFRMKHDVV